MYKAIKSSVAGNTRVVQISLDVEIPEDKDGTLIARYAEIALMQSNQFPYDILGSGFVDDMTEYYL